MIRRCAEVVVADVVAQFIDGGEKRLPIFGPDVDRESAERAIVLRNTFNEFDVWIVVAGPADLKRVLAVADGIEDEGLQRFGNRRLFARGFLILVERESEPGWEPARLEAGACVVVMRNSFPTSAGW